MVFSVSARLYRPRLRRRHSGRRRSDPAGKSRRPGWSTHRVTLHRPPRPARPHRCGDKRGLPSSAQRSKPGRQRGGAQADRIGTNLVVVLPGAKTASGLRGGASSAATLTTGDAQAIRRESTAVTEVSYFIPQSGQVQYSNQNWTTGIQGNQFELSATDQLAHRHGPRDYAGRRGERGAGCRDRPDRCKAALRRIATACWCAHPGQGRTPASNRSARFQGTDRHSARTRTT